MKIRLFFMALCLCVFASCEKDEPVIPDEPVGPPTEQPEEPETPVEPEEPQEPISTDGIINWNNEFIIVGDNNMASIGSNTWSGVTFGAGKYIVVGGSGVAVSVNGYDWSTVSGSPKNLNKVVWNGSRFIAVSGSGYAYTSNDGNYWNNVGKMGGTITGNSVTANGSIAVACGNVGFIAYSNDSGNSWKEIRSGIVSNLNSITFGNGKFVAVGRDGDIVYSSDGRTWSYTTIGSSTWEGIVYADGKFVTIGNRHCAISTDGVSWELHYNVMGSGARTISYNNGVYLVAGNNGMIERSTDGINWEATTSLGTNLFGSTAFVG